MCNTIPSRILPVCLLWSQGEDTTACLHEKTQRTPRDSLFRSLISMNQNIVLGSTWWNRKISIPATGFVVVMGYILKIVNLPAVVFLLLNTLGMTHPSPAVWVHHPVR